MEIELATTRQQIDDCYPVMRQLRPHIGRDDFLDRVRRTEKSGFRLVCLRVGGEPVAVAGIRTGENLAWGRFLYIDDLVTSSEHRSQGYGAALLRWIRAYARSQGCEQLHLDSGMQRVDAHRFYEREGLPVSGLHFAERLMPGS